MTLRLRSGPFEGPAIVKPPALPEDTYFVVHGLPPRGDEMAVSLLIWKKKLMDSISGNLGYIKEEPRSLKNVAERLAQKTAKRLSMSS